MSLITSKSNKSLRLLNVIDRFEAGGRRYVVLRVFRGDQLMAARVIADGVDVLPGIEEVKFHYGNDVVVFTEVIEPRIRLVILGAGHVGRAVAVMGSVLGYEVVVIDDRREFLIDEALNNSGTKVIHSEFDRISELDVISGRTAVVIVTRGHQFDELCLREVFSSGIRPSYVGMIGSKRRVELIKKRLMFDGMKGECVDRLHAPIGLKIGAATPQEIAIAILAEIISEFRKDK